MTMHDIDKAKSKPTFNLIAYVWQSVLFLIVAISCVFGYVTLLKASPNPFFLFLLLALYWVLSYFHLNSDVKKLTHYVQRSYPNEYHSADTSWSFPLSSQGKRQHWGRKMDYGDYQKNKAMNVVNSGQISNDPVIASFATYQHQSGLISIATFLTLWGAIVGITLVVLR